MTYGNYPDLTNVKKILVVKLRHLGDVLLTGPVFTALKNVLPHAKIDAFIYEEAKPMLEGHPAISELIGYDRKWKRKNFLYRLLLEIQLVLRIRKEKYDLVINLTEGDRGAIAAKFSKAKIRVGFAPKGMWQKKIYTHTVKHTPGLKHTVERNLDAVRCIGVFPAPAERELCLTISREARKSAIEKVGGSPFVLIHPTSRWRFKCWDPQKMGELAAWLLKMGKKVVITSGPDQNELEMVEKIVKGLDVLNLAGKISLKELGALIEEATLVISVDSVSFHMASALKKPTVALFGPTSDITWGPWRNPKAKIVSQNFSCRPCYQDGCGGSKYSDCLQTLSTEVVKEAILELKVFPEIGLSRLRIRNELIDASR